MNRLALPLALAAVATLYTSSIAEERLSIPQVRAALSDATFDCTMAGGVTFRLFFPEDTSGEEVVYRFRLAGETQRREMTYLFGDRAITSIRDGDERIFYGLGGGDLRIGKPGEDGAVCRFSD